MEDNIIRNVRPDIHNWLCTYIYERRYSQNIDDYQDKFTLVDGKINVDSFVKFDPSISKISYPFGCVNDDFSCYNTDLISLENCPEIVKGDFYCFRCHGLKNLKGSPKEVGRNFECDCNSSLISLVGAPEKVGGSFDVSDCCVLESLIGCSKHIDGYFSCTGCGNLKSFKGFPKRVGGKIFLIEIKTSKEIYSLFNKDKQKYNKYIDMWFELLECVSEDEKWVYINNYQNKLDYHFKLPIIPKEVINRYKIDFLLKNNNNDR